jgi:hypothetical protein
MRSSTRPETVVHCHGSVSLLSVMSAQYWPGHSGPLTDGLEELQAPLNDAGFVPSAHFVLQYTVRMQL